MVELRVVNATWTWLSIVRDASLRTVTSGADTTVVVVVLVVVVVVVVVLEED